MSDLQEQIWIAYWVKRLRGGEDPRTLLAQMSHLSRFGKVGV